MNSYEIDKYVLNAQWLYEQNRCDISIMFTS